MTPNSFRKRTIPALLLALAVFTASALTARADQRQNYDYLHRVFFVNSLSPRDYFYSQGKAVFPSKLSVVNGKLPIETASYISGPNALELQWTSNPKGAWSATLHMYERRDLTIDFPGKILWIWMEAPNGIAPADLPRLTLEDDAHNFTHPINLGNYVSKTSGLPAGKWVRVRIPLADFVSASVHPFEPHRVSTLVFSQNRMDATAHTLYLDDIRIENDPPASETAPPTPENVQSHGYEMHVDIHWNPIADPNLAQYVIYRSIDGSPYKAIGVQRAGVNRFCDWIGNDHTTASYRVAARTSSLLTSSMSAPTTATTHPMTDDQLLTMVQRASFRYYWEAADPYSGMTRESVPEDNNLVTMGASGFGVMAIIVGAQRGFITQQQALDRLLKITNFLEHADRFHGAWPHFLDGKTGHVIPNFGMYDDGADLVETSFMMEGLLTAREYFKNDGPQGRELYNRITTLWRGIDWNWFRATPKRDALYWHWSPDYYFFIANRLTGWNETMITYILAIASPTHPIPASDFYTGFAGTSVHVPYANGKTYYGIKLDVGRGTGGPLFFTQYSFMGFDPHHYRDRYTDYFANNRAQALINQQYCIHNPHHWKGYGADDWGLTAVDGPDGYVPYEPTPNLDDGTIAPTGAISAFPYTPKASMAALKNFYLNHGKYLWSIYGFRDSFNLQQNWYSGVTLGLNQAPQTVMIENYRTGLIWHYFMQNPEIKPALKNMGFKYDPDAP